LLYEDWPQVLVGLGASGCDCHVVQVLAPVEQDPHQQGEVTFIDMENAQEFPLHLDAATLDAYRREREAWQAELVSQCHRTGLRHSLVSSATPLARVFHENLRQGGLVC
jgi:hypothetical protein